MASFGVVDQAVKSTHSVEEYIKVGMDIVNEVALDFVEHSQDDAENDIVKFRKMMLKFVKMEQEIKQLQEAVEYVKQQPSDSGESLEGLLDQKLAALRQSNNEQQLLQHEKIQDFNQRMHETLHPDEAYSAADHGMAAIKGADADDDVEMTQEIHTKCPYTGQEMVNPVTNKHCGHNYDRDGIMQFIKQRKKRAKCPLGGCSNDKPIEPADLEDNKELKRHIEKMNRQNSKKNRK